MTERHNQICDVTVTRNFEGKKQPVTPSHPPYRGVMFVTRQCPAPNDQNSQPTAIMPTTSKGYEITMTRHTLPTPRLEDAKHFTSADGFFLRTLAAGADRNIAAPSFMRLDPEYATLLGLADGSGTALIVFGYSDGKFRATAIRAFHIHLEPIEQMAVAMWKAKWTPKTTETDKGEAA